ncbi:MAG: hypothetical protein NTW46_03985 [Candidatus Nealsonbacteria bacterium]|nr:hypothetical protein [Candidatus Nealsonbacteria bacterium]
MLSMPASTAETLRKLGFVHVTGLPTYNSLSEEEGEIQASRRQLGRWNCIKGRIVAVTQEGEVWLCDGQLDADIMEAIEKICPNGREVHVPCANGETVFSFHLLARVRDPLSNCDGVAFPHPRPKP